MAADRLETRIDPAVKQAAVEVAKAEKRSLSNYVECLIERDIAMRDQGAGRGWALDRPRAPRGTT
jgi:hypothetical protein